jgi:hypothetical protein
MRRWRPSQWIGSSHESGVEGEKEVAKILIGGQAGRFASEHRQLLNIAQIGLLGGRSQAAQLHVLGHPLP